MSPRNILLPCINKYDNEVSESAVKKLIFNYVYNPVHNPPDFVCLSRVPTQVPSGAI